MQILRCVSLQRLLVQEVFDAILEVLLEAVVVGVCIVHDLNSGRVQLSHFLDLKSTTLERKSKN